MNKTILLIDDDLDDHELFKFALGKVQGAYSVEEVFDAESGLLYLQETKVLPDYIFMDLNMPGISGMECLALIRKSPSLLSIPLFMWSTSLRQHDRHMAESLGAFFFNKPSDPFALVKILSSILTTDHSENNEKGK